MNKKFLILDLFCGAGGLSFGLEQISNFKSVIGLDFNKQALETYKFNHKDAIGIHGDITLKEVKERIINLSKEKGINMIVGGPSCQGFSNKGKMLGLNDLRNYLFKEYVEIVKHVKPKLFILENVKGMISSENGYFINEIVKSFEELGYKISYKVLNAADFGVPQNRERTILIGSLDFHFNFKILDEFKTKTPTVYEAISDLSYLNSGEGEEISDYINEPISYYQKLMRKNSLKLYNHKATNHSKHALYKLSLIPPEKGKEFLPKELLGKQKFKTTWTRLEWNEPSPTIDTRFDTPSNGKNTHPILNRAITPREAARLQSFPDDFIFTGTKTSVCTQIGNAVPPLLAKAIGLGIIKAYSLASDKYEIDNCTIYNEDAYLIYDTLLENNIKVDHIITDPPYNISKKNNFNTMKSSNRKGIYFGDWDNNFDIYNWIEKYSKLVKTNGSMIIFCSYRYISYLINFIEKCDFDVKDIIEWKKTNPMPRNVNRRYVQDTEFAIWAVKKKSRWTFNKPKDKKYLRSTFVSPVVSGLERTSHPTQKSLSIMEELIKIHTNEGDLILDMFLGSGTTAVACLKNNRKILGIEKDKVYFNIAVERIQQLYK